MYFYHEGVQLKASAPIFGKIYIKHTRNFKHESGLLNEVEYIILGVTDTLEGTGDRRPTLNFTLYWRFVLPLESSFLCGFP